MKFDLSYIATQLQQMTMEGISGEQKTKRVSVELPESLYNILEHLAESSNKDIDEVISKFCSINIKTELEKLDIPQIPHIPKVVESKIPGLPDISGLTSQMKEFSDIVNSLAPMISTLEGLQKTMEKK